MTAGVELQLVISQHPMCDDIAQSCLLGLEVNSAW